MLKVNTGALELIQRLLDKRQIKQALKDARVVHRKTPSDATRKMLQRCSLARAEDLHQHGLISEVGNVLDELNSLLPLPEELRNPLSDFLIRSGLYERYAGKFGFSASSVSDTAMLTLADVAVISGRAGMSSLNEGSMAIRNSLQALEKGEIEQAMQFVESIPRMSPFADWKLFVRGLAAYYRGDDTAMKANWDRLDTSRRAIRIAGRLRVLADRAAGGPATSESESALVVIERLAGGEISSKIDELRPCMSGSETRRSAETLRSSLVIIGQREVKLRDRVIELITQAAITRGSSELLDQLMKATSSPAMDPRWNRAQALLAERQFSNDVDIDDEDLTNKIKSHWEKYAVDIPRIATFSESERRLAEALVWNHLGKIHAAWFQGYGDDDDDDEGPFSGHDYDGEEDDENDYYEEDEDELRWHAEGRKEALNYFEKAQSLAPDALLLWKSPIKAAQIWKNVDAEIEGRKKLLDRFPENLESLMSIGFLLSNADRPREAIPYLERALRLKPLDQTLCEASFYAYLGAARQLSLEKDFPSARQHFAKAENCSSAKGREIQYNARRSAFEFKSGNPGIAEEYSLKATNHEENPAYALLQLLIEATRYKLPQSVITGYEGRWLKSLSNKCSSASAGKMAELMNSHDQLDPPYDGIGRHAEHVAVYLKKASRVKFERLHLRSVCSFFSTTSMNHCPKLKNEEELKKAATRGHKQFPDDPVFVDHLAQIELSTRSPFKKNLKATTLLDQALKLAIKHPELATPGLVDSIRLRIDHLESFQPRSFLNLPFGFPSFGSSEDEEDDDERPPLMFNGRVLPPELQMMIEKMSEGMGMTPEEVLKQIEKPHGKRGR